MAIAVAYPRVSSKGKSNLVRIVLLGPPGSGKSTQSAMIAAHYSIPSISAGALLRDSVRKGTDLGRQVQEQLGRGELAPNHLVDLLVFGRLRQPGCGRGFVLDGFPRTAEQAQSLDDFLRQIGKRLNAVVYLHVPDAMIVNRLSARRVCPVCGAIYNIVYNRPRPGDLCYACHTPLRYVAEGVLECEACKTPFTLREDDSSELVKRRLQVQRKSLGAVLVHYRNLGLLEEIDATRPPEQVFDDISVILSGRQRQAGGF